MSRFFIALFFVNTLYSIEGFFDARYHFNQGIGYDKGYTTLDLFALQELNGPLFGLFNARAHFLNQGETAFNGGVGLRYGSSQAKNIFGAHLYYDYRKVSTKAIHQMSCGVEALGECFDLRFEGYCPLKKELIPFGCPYFGAFKGHKAFLSQDVQAPLPFCHLELAYRFCLSNPFFSFQKIGGVAALSPYYLFKFKEKGVHFGKAPGLEARLKLCFSDLFYAEALVTHDRIYKTLVQGMCGVSIPFFRQKGCVKKVDCRVLRGIERQEIIPVQKGCYQTVFVDKKTCIPYRFVFVDESLFGTGEGTYENPYTRLKVASLYSKPNDIFVLSLQDVGLVEEVTLKKGQKLWSAFTPHALDEISIETDLSSKREFQPIRTTITLTEDNEISGFTFSQNGVETGIFGNDVRGRHLISDCFFENLRKGIDLSVKDRVFLTLLNNQFNEISEEGILIKNSGGDLSFIAKNNTFSNLSSALSFDLSHKTTLEISHNTIQAVSDYGILLNQTGESLKATLFKNQIESLGSAVSFNLGVAKVSLLENIMSSSNETVADIKCLGGAISMLNNRFMGILGFEVVSLRRLGTETLVLDVYKNHFLSRELNQTSYVEDLESKVFNFGDPTLLKVKVKEKERGQESLNEQNFGEIQAQNVEYVSR